MDVYNKQFKSREKLNREDRTAAHMLDFTDIKVGVVELLKMWPQHKTAACL